MESIKEQVDTAMLYGHSFITFTRNMGYPKTDRVFKFLIKDASVDNEAIHLLVEERFCKRRTLIMHKNYLKEQLNALEALASTGVTLVLPKIEDCEDHDLCKTIMQVITDRGYECVDDSSELDHSVWTITKD